MATTITNEALAGERSSVPTFVNRIKLVGDNPYVAGGFPMGLATLLPNRTILGATSGVQMADDWGFFYDRANDKLMVYIISTGAEAGAIDLTTLIAEILVFSE